MILGNTQGASPAVAEGLETLSQLINPSNDPEGLHLYRVQIVSDNSFECIPYRQLGTEVFDWGRFKIPETLLYRGNGLFIVNKPTAKPKP